MKCFVSGGAGVIGRELVSRLVSRGHQVIVGDLQERPKDFPEPVDYMHGDLNHLAFDLECDVFYHLAATFERLEETPAHWDENYRHNVGLSHHLLNVVKAKRVVFASSYLIEPSPRNLTGAAKLYTECELEFLRKHKGQDSVSARIYRSYGCGSRDVISRWVRAAIKGEPISVFNGLTSLDFIYAGDVAAGLIALADSNAKGHVPLGTGSPTAILTVANIIHGFFPKASIAYWDDQSPKEQSRSPQHYSGHTLLSEGIARIIDYEKKRCAS